VSLAGLELTGVLLLLCIAIVVQRFFAFRLDKERVRASIEALAGEVLSWEPFERWLGARVRTYRIRYRDREGNARSAYCMTGFFAGVSFTEDTIERSGSEGQTPPRAG